MSSSPRERLVAAGLRLLESEGAEALQARKVATEVGASTMAVYTHFGGMDGLLAAIVEESFVRFGDALAAVPVTDDPVADFMVQGYAYWRFALASPQRYRLMFGLVAPRLNSGVTHDKPVGEPTFGELVTVVERMIAAGRVRADDEVDVAGRIWAMIHGVVLLEIVGFLGPDGAALTTTLVPLIVDLLVGMGADRDDTQRSMQAAAEIIASSHMNTDI